MKGSKVRFSHFEKCLNYNLHSHFVKKCIFMELFLSYFNKEYDVNFYSDEDETTTSVFANPSKAICRHQNDVNQC